MLPVAYVDIRFSAHATEDVNKVVAAVRNILPTEEDEEFEYNQSVVEGHYGNPITFFEARIDDSKLISRLIENLAANLSSLDKEELTREINRCVEKGNLYIRLDKQTAFLGKLKLVTSDPIRVRIRFRKSKLEDVIQICKEFGLIT
ncbi:MAG: RNA-binding domain-containing protein [Candidatus Bathyarchaeia archaeon]